MCAIYHIRLFQRQHYETMYSISDDLQYGRDRFVDRFAIGYILRQDLKSYSYTSAEFEKN